jgi:hypothetical protein
MYAAFIAGGPSVRLIRPATGPPYPVRDGRLLQLPSRRSAGRRSVACEAREQAALPAAECSPALNLGAPLDTFQEGIVLGMYLKGI